MPTRRAFLAGLAAAAALPAVPGGAAGATTVRPETRLDRMVGLIDPVIAMRNVHTGEELRLRYFGPTGYRIEALQAINWLMRDWRENAATRIDARLLWTLSAIRMAAIRDGHSGDILLTSGFRTRKTNETLRRRGVPAAFNSMHLQGRAADISLPGVSARQVSDYAAWLQVGGVGHYPGGGFTHIDSGRERRWG